MKAETCVISSKPQNFVMDNYRVAKIPSILYIHGQTTLDGLTQMKIDKKIKK